MIKIATMRKERITKANLATGTANGLLCGVTTRAEAGNTLRRATARWLCVPLLAISGTAFGQASAIHRQPLQTADFPGNGLHATTIRTTLDAGGLIAPHRHPGLEIAYVAAGMVEVTIGDRQPSRITAGGSFQVTPGTRHSVRNPTGQPAVLVSTYIVDPSQPLATPVP